MKKYLFFALVAILSSFVGGCRLGVYDLEEPIDGRAIQVKSGDRIRIELEENATTGFVWMAECDDDEVRFEREVLENGAESPLCGAPNRIRFTIRVLEGFDEPAHVKFAYKRPWKGGGTAREINILLYRKPEDNAPWK